jgi:hypothetical protein
VLAILFAAAIAVEEGRQHLARQRRRDELRLAQQRCGDLLAKLGGKRAALFELPVVLDLRALGADRGAAVATSSRLRTCGMCSSMARVLRQNSQFAVSVKVRGAPG